MKAVRYYESFSQDFESTENQAFTLPENYEWIKRNVGSKILSAVIYGLALVIGFVYCRLFLHMKIIGRKSLKSVKTGFFMYGNHTQPFGDVFIPALCAFPKRIYTVVSSANYGIPVIGRILPFLGALPIPDSLHGIKELNRAISLRLKNSHPIIIYPEAHVWKYYTDIRPFPTVSFKYPVKSGLPSFSFTAVYKKSRFFKKPICEIYIDGPFYPEGETVREKAEDLHKKIYTAMKKRCKDSNYSYIEYKKSENETE